MNVVVNYSTKGLAQVLKRLSFARFSDVTRDEEYSIKLKGGRREGDYKKGDFYLHGEIFCGDQPFGSIQITQDERIIFTPYGWAPFHPISAFNHAVGWSDLEEWRGYV